jgi:hypothetical protein
MIVASSPVWLGQAGLHVFGPQRRRLERVYGSVGPTREEGKIVASRVSLFFPSTAGQILGRYKIGFLHLEMAWKLLLNVLF